MDKGPLAVARYESVAMLLTRCVAKLGLERQKKHSAGVGGPRGRFEWW